MIVRFIGVVLIAYVGLFMHLIERKHFGQYADVVLLTLLALVVIGFICILVDGRR